MDTRTNRTGRAAGRYAVPTSRVEHSAGVSAGRPHDHLQSHPGVTAAVPVEGHRADADPRGAFNKSMSCERKTADSVEQSSLLSLPNGVVACDVSTLSDGLRVVTARVLGQRCYDSGLDLLPAGG